MTENDLQAKSPASRVSIDGEVVRRIRESKGLTQLYIATYLGVTTDTVSRWENRRYPTIKWENAEKLAEALEVPISEILDEATVSPEEQIERSIITSSPAHIRKITLSIFAGLTILWLLYLLSTSYLPISVPEITAIRFLPNHTPAGQSFPVVIKVESKGAKSFSFIIQETLPDNCTPIKGTPLFISSEQGSKTIKWISNSHKSPFYLAYLAKVSPDFSSESLDFQGSIKIDKTPNNSQQIQGSATIRISNYHWADSNADGLIDDVEILSIYNSFEALKKLGVDLELIESIWSGKGYYWDNKDRNYSVIRHPPEGKKR